MNKNKKLRYLIIDKYNFYFYLTIKNNILKYDEIKHFYFEFIYKILVPKIIIRKKLYPKSHTARYPVCVYIYIRKIYSL